MSKGLLAHNGFLIRKGFKAEENGFLAHKGLLNIVSGVPFKSDLTRRHYTRSDYTLPDLVGSNDGQLLPLASSVTSTSVITFDDLTGVTITSYEGDQVLSISGNTIVASGSGVVHSLLLSNGSFYPIIHLYEDIVNGDKITDLTDINGVYAVGGSLHLQNYGGVDKADDTIIPNGYDSEALYDAVDGDTFFTGSTTRLNLLHSKLRLYTLGDTDQAQMMWDMSNITYWKPSVQDLLTYDSTDTGLHDISHMNQDFINMYVQEPWKYAIWVKIKDNQISDLFTYPVALEGSNVCEAKAYVDSYENFTAIDLSESISVICNKDIINS